MTQGLGGSNLVLCVCVCCSCTKPNTISLIKCELCDVFSPTQGASTTKLSLPFRSAQRPTAAKTCPCSPRARWPTCCTACTSRTTFRTSWRTRLASGATRHTAPKAPPHAPSSPASSPRWQSRDFCADSNAPFVILPLLLFCFTAIDFILTIIFGHACQIPVSHHIAKRPGGCHII